MARQRAPRIVVGLAVAILVAACGSPAAPGSSSGAGQTAGSASSEPEPTPDLGDTQQVSLVYTGTLTFHRRVYDTNHQLEISDDMDLAWTYRYDGPMGVLDGHTPPQPYPLWTSVDVSGRTTNISYNGFGVPSVDCDGTIQAIPNQTTSPVVVTPPPAPTLDYSKVQIWVTPPVSPVDATVQGCGEEGGSYIWGPDTRFGGMDERFPKVVWDINGDSQDFNYTWDYDLGRPDSPDENHYELTSNLSLSGVTLNCPATAAAPAIRLAAMVSAYDTKLPICPIIHWANAPGGQKDITGKTVQTPLGMNVVLAADLCCDDVRQHKIKWTIEGQAVAGYDVDYPTGSHGIATPLPASLTDDHVSFYWYAGTSATVTLSVDGHAKSATFMLVAPEAALSATTCGAGVITKAYPDRLNLGVPAFGLGINDVCGATTQGISWSGGATGGTPGLIAMIQLYLDTLTHNGHECAIQNEGNGLAADNQTFYPPLPPAGAPPPDPADVVTLPGNYFANDSPGFPLSDVGSYTRSFEAQDFLMYKSGDLTTDSIWVPLRWLGWHWSATATGISTPLGSSWSVDNVTNPPANLTSVPWTQLPTWSWVDTNRNGFKC